MLLQSNPVNKTQLGPEKMSLVQSVLIKWVYFKENVWNKPRKLSIIAHVHIKRVSPKQGCTVTCTYFAGILSLEMKCMKGAVELTDENDNRKECYLSFCELTKITVFSRI